MPRSCIKESKTQYPPIDWLLAAILERKHTLKLDWRDIAFSCGVSYNSMRLLVSRKPPEEWPKDVRDKVCDYLGINVRRTVMGVEDVAELHSGRKSMHP